MKIAISRILSQYRLPGKNRHSAVYIFVILIVIFSGCNRGDSRSDGNTEPVITDWEDEAEMWADSVMGLMDARDRAAQLVMPAIYANAGDADFRRLKEYADSLHVGGIVLLKGSMPDARALSDSITKWSSVIPFIAIDGEWGLAMRLNDAPKFPVNRDISSEADENDLYDYGYEVAREARAVGINMILGPVLDVIGTDRPQGGLSYRSFGKDPEHVSRLGIAYSRGIEDGNVVSVAKHFPGHGRADEDSHKNLPIVKASRAALDTTDLLPFRRYSDASLSAIMTGHLSVPALDSSMKPATVSDSILNRVLRRDLKFKGLIITDAMNMAPIAEYSAADAIKAGADIVIAPFDTQEAIRGISELDSTVLAAHCRRVLLRKYRLLGPQPRRESLDSLAKHASEIARRLQ